MEALGMMGEEFSLPFPPYHQQSHETFGLLGQFLNFHPLSRYINVPALFGQPNIANILSHGIIFGTHKLPEPLSWIAVKY
jgi:hypothetical protein